MSLVNYEVRESTAEMTLNRPDKLNAINDEMLRELGAALDTAKDDSNVRVLLLRGNGRAFSAGFDMESGNPPCGRSKNEYLRQVLTRDFELIMKLRDFPKPAIAAVHGYCLGSSMEISAVCDLTIAADGCRFGAPEVRFGSGIVCMILPWIIGQKAARELLLAGSDRIDAHRAVSIGLVNRVVEEQDLLAEARALAGEIALNDPVAVQLTKKALNRMQDICGIRESLLEALETDIQIECSESPESKAFNEVLESRGLQAALQWRARQVSGA